jgi:hypothetical protein
MKKTIVILLILSFVGTSLLMGMLPQCDDNGKCCREKTEKCENDKKNCTKKHECKKHSEACEKVKKCENKKNSCKEKCQHEKKVKKNDDKST